MAILLKSESSISRSALSRHKQRDSPLNHEDPSSITDASLESHAHDVAGDGAGAHSHDDHSHDDHGHDDHGHDDHDHDHDDHDHGSGVLASIRSVFSPHSHDAADSTDSALESSEKGIKAVKISLVALLITAFAQVAIVVVTGSVALLADTIHNFSDALTSIPLWIAFILGRRAATRSYTYGYRRAEDLSGLFIIFMIALSAVIAGWESINRLFDPRQVENLWLLGAAGVVGLIGNELVAIYRIRVGREIGSAALIADGHHARTDGLTSLAVVLGAIGVGLGFPAADPIIGLLITVAILFVLRDASKKVFRRLMDGVEPETVDRIEAIGGSVNGVVSIEQMKVRWVGHRLDANFTVRIDPDLTVAEGHEVARSVETAVTKALPKLDYVVIAIAPDGTSLGSGLEAGESAVAAGRLEVP